MVFSYHPTGHGIYMVPASKVKITTREKPWPIFKLDGTVIESVEQFGFDRIFKLNISLDKKQFIIQSPSKNQYIMNDLPLIIRNSNGDSFEQTKTY